MTRKLIRIDESELVNVSFEESSKQNLFTDMPEGRLRDTREGRAFLRKNGFTGEKHTKWTKGEFVAWDGEGVSDESGDHHYVMLANSNGAYTSNSEGLTTRECFDRFMDSARLHPKAINVIFAGGYDANMILRSLPKRVLHRIYEQESAYWQEYAISYRPHKYLRVHSRELKLTLTLWDVFPFFQCSFVKAVEQYLGEVPELENIRLHKAQRSEFTLEAFDEILAYCQDELTVLVRLVKKLRENLIKAEIVLSRWDGPGAVAASLFAYNGVKHHKLEMKGETLGRVNRAAQYAYAGGRIEALRFGDYQGTVYCYDLNSAYPYAIAELPSLSGSTWRHTETTDDIQPFSLYRVRLSASKENLRYAYPLFFRTERGMIYFPLPCAGWYWTPEVELLRDLGFDYSIDEAWLFEPANNDRPFTFVREMYEKRQALKAAGDGAEKAIKLGLNSLYGKMIQQKGWSPTRGIPPFHQLEWGGYVTSKTRATIYRAAYPALSDGIIGFETDGIFSTVPLNVRISNELGGWSEKRYDGITYVQSGVYWILDNGTWKGKHRGFDPGTLNRDRVLEAWGKGQQKLEGQLTRFRTLGTSLVSEDRFLDWCKWITEPRELTLYPNTKRTHVGERVCCYKRGRQYAQFPYGKLHSTSDNGWFAGESFPYPLVWKEDEAKIRAAWIELADLAQEEAEMKEW